MVIQFGNLAADGSTAAKNSPGGKALIIVWGDFGGGTLTPEICNDPDEEGWVAIRDSAGSDIALTQAVNDEYLQYVPPEMKLRFTLAGATDPDLNIKVVS